MELLKAFLAARRTSTKSGAAGIGALLLAAIPLLPYYDQINGYIMQACQSEQGPLMFFAGGGLVLVTTYITARKSKTPPNPGAL